MSIAIMPGSLIGATVFTGLASALDGTGFSRVKAEDLVKAEEVSFFFERKDSEGSIDALLVKSVLEDGSIGGLESSSVASFYAQSRVLSSKETLLAYVALPVVSEQANIVKDNNMVRQSLMTANLVNQPRSLLSYSTQEIYATNPYILDSSVDYESIDEDITLLYSDNSSEYFQPRMMVSSYENSYLIDVERSLVNEAEQSYTLDNNIAQIGLESYVPQLTGNRDNNYLNDYYSIEVTPLGFDTKLEPRRPNYEGPNFNDPRKFEPQKPHHQDPRFPDDPKDLGFNYAGSGHITDSNLLSENLLAPELLIDDDVNHFDDYSLPHVLELNDGRFETAYVNEVVPGDDLSYGIRDLAEIKEKTIVKEDYQAKIANNLYDGRSLEKVTELSEFVSFDKAAIDTSIKYGDNVIESAEVEAPTVDEPDVAYARKENVVPLEPRIKKIFDDPQIKKEDLCDVVIESRNVTDEEGKNLSYDEIVEREDLCPVEIKSEEKKVLYDELVEREDLCPVRLESLMNEIIFRNFDVYDGSERLVGYKVDGLLGKTKSLSVEGDSVLAQLDALAEANGYEFFFEQTDHGIMLKDISGHNNQNYIVKIVDKNNPKKTIRYVRGGLENEKIDRNTELVAVEHFGNNSIDDKLFDENYTKPVFTAYGGQVEGVAIVTELTVIGNASGKKKLNYKDNEGRDQVYEVDASSILAAVVSDLESRGYDIEFKVYDMRKNGKIFEQDGKSYEKLISIEKISKDGKNLKVDNGKTGYMVETVGLDGMIGEPVDARGRLSIIEDTKAKIGQTYRLVASAQGVYDRNVINNSIGMKKAA